MHPIEVRFNIPEDSPIVPGSAVSTDLWMPFIPRVGEQILLGRYADIPTWAGGVSRLNKAQQQAFNAMEENEVVVTVEGVTYACPQKPGEPHTVLLHCGW